ncbi:DUF1501 domain-containing protein [Schlesneria sp. T3-172]|uniref:DUF1501 domain-containing protein n=1 Tax=Schlesneria sphaerica TaxID=3373610 RepID=UPI0037C9282A
MLRVLGSARRCSKGLSRRALLQTGALGLCGVAGAKWPRNGLANEDSNTANLPGFGRAKRCLVLYVYGAWSQLDTFDPKPDAPAEIRGEFDAIESCISGVRVCEHLPLSARVLDRCTLVRSMSHPWNIHSASYTLTGNPNTELIEGRQRHPDQWPYLGSVVDYLTAQGDLRPPIRGTPTNVMLPWRQSLFARPNKRSGTFGGFLGTSFDPLWTEFHGEAPLGDPFRAITPEGRFQFGAGDADGITLDTLDTRRSLLTQLEAQRAHLQRASSVTSYTRQREFALDFLATSKVRDALRIDREALSLREDYGMTLFGQACLSARRLLEADVKFVTVVWDEYGQTDESWDTHYDHHSRMKGYLLPSFDKAFSTLLTDLDTRGLLDDTLVLCLSEHGRTPHFDITSSGAPGRGHWSRAYSQIFAGAGIPGGRTIGATDATAAEVTDRPIDPKDILCTAYHLLGIDARRELLMSPSRTVPLVSGGTIVRELLG